MMRERSGSPSKTANDLPIGGKPEFPATNAWIRALQATAPIAKALDRTFPILMDELAERFGDAPALLSRNGDLNYRAAAELSNRYARWGLGQGFAKGDCVGLLLPNCSEYMPIWLGLSGIGCIVALINANLESASLAHCIDAARPKAIIASLEHLAALKDAGPYLHCRPQIWAHGAGAPDLPNVSAAAAGLPGEPLDSAQRRDVTINDPALYIYTSGTTGLPKAAKVSHYRIMSWTHWFSGLMAIAPDDRLYNCLPMYHSIGGVAAPGAVLAGGGSVLIREKFSARSFWEDVAVNECTIFQYIGELCRYLAGSPPSVHENRHRLRLCCGNGLSAPVWQEFQRRFNIANILEFYAATEGTFSLYNVDGVPGSIGRVPPFLPQSSQIRLVKHDIESGAIMRGRDGFGIPCEPDEAGEAIGRISENAASRFEGYTTEADTEKKVLRDVFQQGDAWFRTGDLMRKDKKGFYYFVDRIGDTFRWKGENVSTSEVRDCLAGLRGVLDVTVYGVAVPGCEGRAGMAVLVTDESFDIEGLGAHMEGRLPSYARPLFLRLKDKIEVTSTFKHKKSDLARDGFDPRRIADRLYLRDPQTQAYVTLDAALFGRISDGSIRL
ncbi:MAG: long-chain-acyl-CoA synthetase [Rhodomicrobium sp.]